MMRNPLEDFSFSDPFQSWWPFILAGLVGIITVIRSYIGGPDCPEEFRAEGETVVLTGGSSGVGLQVAVGLLNRGAELVIATRDVEITRETFAGIKTSGKYQVKYLDLASFSSIHTFAKDLGNKKIDILINNAGILLQSHEVSQDGFEKHWAVNFLGPLLLTTLLLPNLEATPRGRVINTAAHIPSSVQMRLDLINQYDNTAFARSKLALLIMTHILPTYWKGSKVTMNAVNPGLVRGTRHLAGHSILNAAFYYKLMVYPITWLLSKTAQQASQTIIYLATSPQVAFANGRLFSNCSEIEMPAKGKDLTMGHELIRQSLISTGQIKVKKNS